MPRHPTRPELLLSLTLASTLDDVSDIVDQLVLLDQRPRRATPVSLLARGLVRKRIEDQVQ